MENPAPNFPREKKLSVPFAWIFTWRTVRRALICLAVLVTIIAIFYTEEGIRGRRAWNEARREVEAKGFNTDWHAYVPPPVRDDENFAKTPFLAKLFEFNLYPRKEGEPIYHDPDTNFALPSDVKYVGTWTKAEVINLGAYLNAMDHRKISGHETESNSERGANATEMLRRLEKFKPIMDELEAASQRPHSRFDIHYDDADPYGILLPHLALMKRTAIIFQVRASAELVLGRTDSAFNDTQMTLYLSDTMKQEPFLICGLVRLAIFNIGLQTIWEGIASHQWTDAQLMEFQKHLKQYDFFADYQWDMHGGEGAFSLRGIDYIHHDGKDIGSLEDHFRGYSFLNILLLGGWFDVNKAEYVRALDEVIFPAMDLKTRLVHPSENARRYTALSARLHKSFLPTHFYATFQIPALEGAASKFGQAQTRADQAITACALERYYLAHKNYPESLDVLVLQYLDAVPADIIGGEPLKYRRESDGRFLLYSIGWNEKDDGGEIALKNDRDKGIDNTQGDWVWPQYPTTGR